MRLFVENNVKSLFSQSNRELGGEFHELRGYMLAKLMWNPQLNEREIMLDLPHLLTAPVPAWPWRR